MTCKTLAFASAVRGYVYKDCSLFSTSYKQDCASETLSPLMKFFSSKVGTNKYRFQVIAHQKLVDFLIHQCSCEFWDHLLCFGAAGMR